MALRTQKLGLNAAWCMAVGGMIGGGIFSVLGVVYSIAGRWAWLSFIIGGAIALATGHSYAQLSRAQQKAGGVYMFLRHAGHARVAGNVAVLLIVAYSLTLSVYAYTFGAYVAHVFNAGALLRPMLSSGILLVICGVNLIGIGEVSALEIVTVWGKLFVLLLIAAVGIFAWQPENLSPEAFEASWTAPLLAAAVIFMAYEGFQLLTYDYADISDPHRLLPRAILGAVAAVMVVYVAIALGAAMLVGADTLIRHKEVALAEAGQAALGQLGLILTVVAAAFSTSSAINATIFSTARLSQKVAADGELPALFERKSGHGMPAGAILVLTAIALALSLLGSLAGLVEAASLLFLVTFAVVNGLAIKQGVKPLWVAVAGLAGAGAASLALLARNIIEHPTAVAGLLMLIALSAFVRPRLLDNRGSDAD